MSGKPLDVAPIDYQSVRVGSLMETLRRGLRPAIDVDTDESVGTIGYDQWRRGVMWNTRDDYGVLLSHLSAGGTYTDAAGNDTAVPSDLLWRPPVVTPTRSFAFPIRLQAWVDKEKPTNDEAIAPAARRKLEVFRSSLLAKWLATGIGGEYGTVSSHTTHVTPNPSLASTAVDLAADTNTAVKAELGIAQILAAASTAEYTGDIVFHANPVLMSVLNRQGLVEQRGMVFWLHGMYRLVVEMGYPGSAPAAYGGSAMPANTSWLYATGPVEWDMGDIDGVPADPEMSRVEPSTLDTWAFASQLAITRFDPITCWAAPIAYGTPS